MCCPDRSSHPRHGDQCFAQALREQGLDEGVDQEVCAGYEEGVEVAHGHEGPFKVGGEVEGGDEKGELGDAHHEGDKVPDGAGGGGNSTD